MRIACASDTIKTLVTKPAPRPISWPDDSQRIVVIGRTGSGKTQFGWWHMSTRSFDTMPWVAFDYKGDKLIGQTEGAEEIDFRKPVPKHPGLYVVRPIPEMDDEKVEHFLWGIWQRGRVGVYFDEGYMIPRKGAQQGILTQGRSKEIPVIMLIQRPAWIDQFVFSETDYAVLFNLNKVKDRARVREEFTENIPAKYRLPQYYSYHYDVGNDVLTPLQPVPDAESILERFDARLGKRNRRL